MDNTLVVIIFVISSTLLCAAAWAELRDRRAARILAAALIDEMVIERAKRKWRERMQPWNNQL